MIYHVLAVTRDTDTGELLGSVLEQLADGPGNSVLVDPARTLDQAETRLAAQNYELVLSEVNLPRNRTSPPDLQEKLGLELLVRLRQRDKRVPFALIDSTSDRATHRRVQEIAWAEYVPRDIDEWEEHVLHVCRKLLLQHTAPVDDLRLKLEILLHPQGKYSYRMKIIGSADPALNGALELDQDTLEDVRRRSDWVVRDKEAWEAELSSLGRQLGKQIFGRNPLLLKNFSECLGVVGRNRSKVSIAFEVEENLHPIVLEAIQEFSTGDYWMLEAPLYRRLNIRSNRYALFEDEVTRVGSINCLIINANIAEWFDPKLGVKLQPLKHVPIEVDELKIMLETLRKEDPARVGVVETLDRDIVERNFGGDFERAVRETLHNSKWHIVHYAGHSHYDKNSKQGYIFLPGKKVTSVTAENFANWLEQSEVRLVYLSSCHSSEQDFAFMLANRLVPAVVGFRWDLDDPLASEYAKCFYTQLFAARSLERAFLAARRTMHAQHRENPIWAAPMLVIQTTAD